MTTPRSGEFSGHQPQPEILSSFSEHDFARLAQILPGAFGSISPEDVATFIPLAIEAPNADVIVSRSFEGSIASVMLVNVLHGAGKLRGHIDDVATHQDSLRQGHCGAVLDYALGWFRDRGVKRVGLTSEDSRQPAHRLYESRGFVIHDTNRFQLDLY